MLVFVSLTAFSCKDNNREENVDPSGMDHEKMEESSEMMERGTKTSENMGGNEMQSSQTATIVNNYLKLKDALVADNPEGVAEAGKSLATAFEQFDRSEYTDSEQQELKDIVEDAKEHAEHMPGSDIAHQREHFELLSADMADMLAITGSPQTLYQQFCPMYNENKGGMWLSANEQIRNPYFGQKMLHCGEVQKEI